MKMKKHIKNAVFFGVVLSALMMVSAFAYSENKGERRIIPYEGTALAEGRIINGEVDYGFLVKDLKELELLSDISIKGKVLPDSYMVLKDSTSGWVSGYTKTKIEVTEVFSGDIKVGDIIEVAEPYYESSIESQTYFITNDGYLPSIVEDEYIWLLEKYDENSERESLYGMFNTYVGRFPASNVSPSQRSGIMQFSKSVSNSELELLPESNTTLYREIFQEILNRFN